MLLDKTVIITLAKQNRKHYLSFGYDGKNGDAIEVLIEHLPKNVDVIVRVECDYCGEVMLRTYANHFKQINKDIIKKDSCTKCAGKKRLESNLVVYGIDSLTKLDSTKQKMKNTLIERYGVEHQMYLQETKNKIRETNMDRYGVESPMQLQETKDKIIKTNQLRYGKDYYTQTEEYLENVKNTNIEKYGVGNVFHVAEFVEKQRLTVQEIYGCDNVFQNEEIKTKSRASMKVKYGVEHPMHDEEIKNKTIRKQRDTLSKNGNVKTSKQQIYLHNILGGELNFQVDRINLDVAFPEEKIYLEYNGGGHDLHVKTGKISQEEFKIIEMKRYLFLKSKGWKQIELNSPCDYLPTDNLIFEEILKAKDWLNESDNTLHWHYTINIGKIKNDENFGKLRKV